MVEREYRVNVTLPVLAESSASAEAKVRKVLASVASGSIDAYNIKLDEAIPHGTLSGYNYHRCRCEACRGRKSQNQRLRRWGHDQR